MGTVSDSIGRKKALIISAILCAVFGILVAMMPVGTSALIFGTVFFLFGLFGAGMYPMYLGTLPAESVPPEIAGTAVAIPVAIGETLGAALMPTIAGMLSDRFSLFAPMCGWRLLPGSLSRSSRFSILRLHRGVLQR